MDKRSPLVDGGLRICAIFVLLINLITPVQALAQTPPNIERAAGRSSLRPDPRSAQATLAAETPTATSPSTETPTALDTAVATETVVLSQTPIDTPPGTVSAIDTALPTAPSATSETPTSTAPITETGSPTSTPENTGTPTGTPAPSETPTASFTPTAAQKPLLSLNLSANLQQAKPGDLITFTVEIANQGATIASGVQFSNTLPNNYAVTEGGLGEFTFDRKNQQLTWRPDNPTASLAPNESAKLTYEIRLEGNLKDVQLADDATLSADGLEEPIIAETTLTIISKDQTSTVLDAKGGKALGLDGRVSIELPTNAISTSNIVVIESLDGARASEAPVKDKPPLMFALSLLAPQPDAAYPVPAPGETVTPEPPTETPVATEPSPTASALEATAPTPDKSGASTIEPSPTATPEATETPHPNSGDSKEEKDRIIPLKAVEAKFTEPVHLTVSFDGLADLAALKADKTPVLMTLDETSGVWIRIPISAVDRGANAIKVDILHFSVWGAGIGFTFPQNGASLLLFDSASADLFTGHAKYSIPIWVPSGRNGMEPSLSLSYSSGKVDGLLGYVQSPWVGMGWNVDTVEIARKITSCTSCFPQSYGYEDKYMLFFNGTGYELIPDGSITGRYHTKDETFLYIQRHNSLIDTASTANASGEWWEVVEKNGTRWRLGWNADSEQREAMPGYPGAATGIWATMGYAGYAVDVVPFRWRADQVTDTHGNRMSLIYYEEAQQGYDGFYFYYYDRASYLDTITYTSHTSGSPAPAYSVVFVHELRDQEITGVSSGDNWDSYRLGRIEVRYGANVIRTYSLGYTKRTYNDGGTRDEMILTSLAISGGTASVPAISFNYADKDNRADCGLNCPKWTYPRLESVSNGWGSTATFTYGNDGRSSASWYNWRVEALQISDGVSTGPAKSTYAYSTPCYNDSSAGWCNGSNIGELIGYGQTTVSTKDFDGSTTLAITVHKFHTDEQKAGREYELQNQNASGTILNETDTAWSVVTTMPPGWYFRYPNSVSEYVRTSSLTLVKTVIYLYDNETGNLTEVQELDGSYSLYRTTDYTYNTNTSPSVWILNTVSQRVIKDGNNAVVSEKDYGYDGNLPGSGSPTVGELTLGRVVDGTQTIDTKYSYDTYGNVTETRSYKSYGTTGSQPSGSYLSSSTTYDSASHTYAVIVTNSLTQPTTTDYDYGLGLPTTVTDPNSSTTTTAYDGLGRVTSIKYQGYAQPNIKYTYPTTPVSAPFAIKMELWDETASVYRSAWQMLDGLGRVIQTQAPAETAGDLILNDTSFNAQGLTQYAGLPRTLTGAGGSYFTPIWGSVPHSTTAYDALGRTTSVTYADSSQETLSYSGLRTTSIDRNSHQKIQENDAFGRLVKVEEYTGSNSYTLYATTTYGYDVRDLLKSVTDAAGNQTTIGYNGYGRKNSMTDPDMGSWSYGYDVLGNLTSQTDARNCVTNVTYDDLNRPTGKTYSGPGACATTPSVAYTYDSTTGGNKGVGHRTGMTDGSGSTSWFYNALGQVTTETHNLDSINYPISFTYDAFNRLLTQTLPSSETLSYSYNAMGTVSGVSGTNTYLSNVHYTASGQVTSQQLGNGLLQQSCYDANTLRLSSRRVYTGSLLSCNTGPSNPRLNLSYVYQPNGNVSQVVDGTRGETLNYTYDELDRLLSANGPYSQSYSYDSIGNFSTKGNNTTSSVLSLTRITSGFDHSCGITSAGGVVCWGSNSHGQLGDATTVSRLTPVAVNGLSSSVAAVKAGGFHSCGLTASGGLKCWGYNLAGQLGDGTNTDRSAPQDVSGLTSGVAAVSAGYLHTCALTTGGGAKCWGDNTYGQIGDGTTTQRTTPTNVSGLASGVIAISAGTRHVCALTSGGGVKCWGQNAYGQLGDGTTTQRTTPVDVSGLTSGVIAISAGEQHTCALLSTGGVKCWGANGDGQLGDGTNMQRLTPVDVSGLASGVASIAVGNFHSCAKTTGAGMKCWGRNSVGQLGDGTTAQRTTPVYVSGLTSGVTSMAPGLSHSCALTTDGRVKCWGENNTLGRLGDGTTVQRLTPVGLSGVFNGSSLIRAGGFHTCGLTAAGGLQCWGSNSAGQLGDGSTTNRTSPVNVSGLTSGVASVSAEYQNTCALTASGGVKCWGDNAYGQVGDGTTTQRTTATNVSGLTSGMIAISVGARHACALTASGGVKCWGQNAYGQLGDGTTTQRTSPVDVSGLTSGVIAISAGEQHTCALLSTGGVKCWGTNSNGQLGDGTTTQRLTAVDVSGLTSGVAAISAGNFHTCALTTGGGLKCWGNNGHGQLGDGTTTQRNAPVDVSGLTSGAVAVAAGIDQTCAETSSGGMKCWGYNNYGRLGDGTTTQRTTPVDVSGLTSGVVAVTTGFDHSCALTSSVQKCWGSNTSGQVGDGTTTQRLTPVSVLSGGIASYTYGSASHKHAVTALSSGESYAYDANGNMTQRIESGLTYTQTFDAENRLVSVAVSGQTTQFIYDGDGNLAKKIKPDGSWTIYVGKVYEVDKTSGGVVTRTLSYYGVAGAMRIGSTLYYVLTDQLGSASVVTDNSGAIVGEQRYYPYGETRVPSGNMYTDRLFTGQRQMAGLGNIYDYGARFYSPFLGRFLSADTIVPSAGNPQALNRYSYVINSPLNFYDPTGHCIQEGDAPPGSIANRNICRGATRTDNDPIKLVPRSQQLIGFAKNVRLVPEEVIAIGLGHEMAGANASYMETFKQHVYNRFIWYADQRCDRNLTHNCMLNFYVVEYESVFNFLDVSKYTTQPELFIREQGAPNWDRTYIDAGEDIVGHFWLSLNPAFDPVNNPQDASKPFDTGVYAVAEVNHVLGRPPSLEAGFLGIMPGRCPSTGAKGYVLIMSYGAWKSLDSLFVC